MGTRLSMNKIELQKKQMTDDFRSVVQIIQSCKNLNQLETARNVIRNFDRKWCYIIERMSLRAEENDRYIMLMDFYLKKKNDLERN